MAFPRALWGPVAVMLVTGACNTLLMKFLVRQEAPTCLGCPPTNFDFPFFQTLLMMLGELMCLGVFFLQPKEKGKQALSAPWIMALPVSCDWAATTTVNAAYVMIPASTIQMCRGCVVIFTCFLSVTVLKRRQEARQYFGVVLVALGITIVSAEAIVYGTGGASSGTTHSAAWVGICLCIAGQVFQSTMLVVEEKFLSQHHVPPLQMVGLEGFFGCIIGVVLLTTLQRTGIEKSTEALYMLHSSGWIQFGCIASMFSIAFFNWSGVTVTQQASAVARSTIDVSRTSIIWVLELAMRWNTFSWLQLLGFSMLVCGTLIYNGIVKLAFLEKSEEEKPIVDAAQKA